MDTLILYSLVLMFSCGWLSPKLATDFKYMNVNYLRLYINRVRLMVYVGALCHNSRTNNFKIIQINSTS